MVMVNQAHEGMYRRTIDSFIRSVQSGSFSEANVPALTDQLRSELGQCIELGLISPEFYSERMEILAKIRGVLFD